MKLKIYKTLYTQLSIGMLLMLLSLFSPTQAHAVDSYTVDYFDYGGGFDINNLGHVAGNYNGAKLWRDGQVTSLGTLNSFYTNTSAFGLNDADYVVGDSKISAIYSHAFIWTEQTGMQDLTPGFNNFSRAYKINNNNQVVGTKFIDGKSHAMIWKVTPSSGSANIQETDLGFYSDAYTGSVGLDINENGDVVGYLTYGGGATPSGTTPFVWRNGSMELLPTLGFASNEAASINDNGVIVGFVSTSPSCCIQSAMWINNELEMLPPFGSANQAEAINNDGVIVGTSVIGNRYAYIYKNGQMQKINDLIANKPTFTIAYDINNSGQIFAKEVDHFYVLSPIADTPTESNPKWKPLLDHAEQEYTLSQSFGGISVGYYRQILFIACAASQSTRTVCEPMQSSYNSISQGWADDWVFDVFEGYLNPDGYYFSAQNAQTIASQANQVSIIIRSICHTALIGLPIGQSACAAIPDNDIGALTAGIVHYIEHLQPNFVRATESRLHAVQIPATNTLKSNKELESAMLSFKPVFNGIRAQHQQLFDNAVIPGFTQNASQYGVSAVGSAIANYIVPQSAVCVREYGFIEAMKSYPGGRIDASTAQKIYALYQKDNPTTNSNQSFNCDWILNINTIQGNK